MSPPSPTGCRTWFWAQTYDGNIAGVAIPPPGVYPTPIYEMLMCFVAFAVLWKLRSHSHAAGWLFCLYLLLAGIERLAVEPIRVNTTYSLFGTRSPGAIIAVRVVAGIVVMWWRQKPARLVPSSYRPARPRRLSPLLPGTVGTARSRALTPSRRAADNTASTEAVAMFACRPAP